jgi:hypothetical protein
MERSLAAESRPLRDSDIRLPLQLWLCELHADQPDTKIIHEFSVPRPSARVDLAVINGRFAGFEIKSDVDSFSRLGRQTTAFSQVFERMTLVTTARHADRAPDHIPDWWGIVVYNGCGFSNRRRGKLNRSIDAEKLLHALTCPELLQVELLCASKTGAKSRSKQKLISDVLQARKPRVQRAIRTVLKKR